MEKIKMDSTIEKIAEWKEKAGKWDIYKETLEREVLTIREKLKEIAVLLNNIYPEIDGSVIRKKHRDLKTLFNLILEGFDDDIEYDNDVIQKDNSLNWNQKSDFKKFAIGQGFVFKNRHIFIRKSISEIKFEKVSVMR